MVDGVGGVVGRINGGGCRFCYPDINWKQHRTETLFLTEGPASFPGPTQPHSQAPPSLIPRPHPASFPGPTQLPYCLLECSHVPMLPGFRTGRCISQREGSFLIRLWCNQIWPEFFKNRKVNVLHVVQLTMHSTLGYSYPDNQRHVVSCLLPSLFFLFWVFRYTHAQLRPLSIPSYLLFPWQKYQAL